MQFGWFADKQREPQQYGPVLEARAQEDVDQSGGIGGEKFTGYEITRYEKVDTFYTSLDSMTFEVYAWGVSFTAEDVTKVGWAGGMMLDSELRVTGYEQHTYFVVCTRSVELEKNCRFLFYDIYNGPNEGAGRENAWYQKHSVYVDRSQWQIIENVHEPIIDKETFENVQRILKRAGQKTEWGRQHSPLVGTDVLQRLRNENAHPHHP